MSDWIDALTPWGEWLYYRCTWFVVHLARLLGVTYRDANALIFFVLWPLVTLGLLALIIGQGRALRRGPPRAHDRRPQRASSEPG